MASVPPTLLPHLMPGGESRGDNCHCPALTAFLQDLGDPSVFVAPAQLYLLYRAAFFRLATSSARVHPGSACQTW
jgi:hypothetical protein